MTRRNKIVDSGFGFDSVLDLRPQVSPKTLRSDPAGYSLQVKDLVELRNSLSERQRVIAEFGS